MFFFSGIFFPLDSFPAILENLAWISPLTNAAHVSRGLMLGQLDWSVAISGLVLGLYTTILLPICVVLMRRRLVK
jgi:lipooligosaccharide transport system permease protein